MRPLSPHDSKTNLGTGNRAKTQECRDCYLGALRHALGREVEGDAARVVLDDPIPLNSEPQSPDLKPQILDLGTPSPRGVPRL